MKPNSYSELKRRQDDIRDRLEYFQYVRVWAEAGRYYLDLLIEQIEAQISQIDGTTLVKSSPPPFALSSAFVSNRMAALEEQPPPPTEAFESANCGWLPDFGFAKADSEMIDLGVFDPQGYVFWAPIFRDWPDVPESARTNRYRRINEVRLAGHLSVEASWTTCLARANRQRQRWQDECADALGHVTRLEKALVDIDSAITANLEQGDDGADSAQTAKGSSVRGRPPHALRRGQNGLEVHRLVRSRIDAGESLTRASKNVVDSDLEPAGLPKGSYRLVREIFEEHETNREGN